ncbi:carboxypeptidase regulatory-like domain-containing protein [Cerasicoccus maritimus]|uniref:carboxypeptidase regulatory-like domain-containing protein n=1 Tax=Cerasicoccus maritimus TaxID=490089 RepID=UPI002852C71D|nr:carboxypeptidase regulatory-like domain-containing protein [Cerasicoccus maritimus]
MAGRVIDESTGFGLEGAAIILDDDPLAEGVAARTYADAFGFYRIADLPVDDYALAVSHPAFETATVDPLSLSEGEEALNVELTPLDSDTPWFDVYVQLNSVVSGVEAAGIPVRCKFDPEGAPTAKTYAAVTDENGCATFRGVSAGSFQFFFNDATSASLASVDTSNFFIEYTSDVVTLTGPHTVSLLLEPKKGQLSFTVDWEQYFGTFGFGDPQPAKNFTIKLTGVDPNDTERELLPTRSSMTDENGEVTFINLPKLAWRVEVSRIGFEMVDGTVIVMPDADGELPAEVQAVHMRNDEDLWAGIGHQLTVPYYTGFTANSFGTVQSDQGFLVPHKGSNSEGIYEDDLIFYTLNTLENSNVISSASGFADFPPGRYDVVVDIVQRMEFAFDGDLTLQSDNEFNLAMTFRGSVENLPGEGGMVVGDIQVELATVEGVLLLMEQDDLQPGSETAYKPRTNETIIFEVHDMAKSKVQSAFQEIEVTTDSQGRYSLELPPGIYGIKLPNMMDGYWGAGIRLSKDEPSGVGFTNSRGWPLADIYEPSTPRSSWGDYIEPRGLSISSGGVYQLDLLVREEVYGIAGEVIVNNDPNENAILSFDQGGESAVVAHRFMDLIELQELEVDLGVDELTAPLYADGEAYRFERKKLPPGTYAPTLTAERANLAPTDASEITLIDFPGPGLPPGGVDFDYGEVSVFPGETIDGAATQIEGDSTLGTSPVIAAVAVWDPDADGGDGAYSSHTTGARIYQVDYAGSLPFSGNPITGHWTDAWFYTEDDWYKLSSSDNLEIIIGGPGNNANPSIPPGVNYSVAVDVRNAAYPSLQLSNVGVLINNQANAAPGTFSGTPDEYPSVALNGDSWTFETGDSEAYATLVNRGDALSPVYSTTMLLSRTLTVEFDLKETTGPAIDVEGVQFTIKGPTGVILPVSIEERYPEGGGAAIEGGFTYITDWVPHYIEVRAPGYQIVRVFVEPDESTAQQVEGSHWSLSNIEVTLDALEPPSVGSAPVFDRRGYFFTGLKRAGDPTLFSEDSAKEALEMTWQASVEGRSYSATLPGFYEEGASTPSGSETYNYDDPVDEVWLIDQRIWSNGSWTLGGFATFTLPAGNDERLSWLADLADDGDDTASQGEPTSEVDLNRGNVWFQRLLATDFETTDLTQSIDATLTLADLPPGYFDPVLVVVTRGGAVLVEEIPELASTESTALFGIRLPDSFATLLDAVALIAGAQATREELEAILPDGRFVALPDFTAEIAAEGEEDPKHVNYNYEFAVDWSEGLGVPGAGILSLAPGFLGGTFESDGAFTLDGDSGDVGLGIGTEFRIDDLTEGNIELKGDGKFDPRSYFPPIIQNLGVEYSIGSVAVKAAMEQISSTEQKELIMKHSVDFSMSDINMRMNLEPVTGKVPYIGPILAGLSVSEALVIYGAVDADIALNATRTWKTDNPTRTALQQPEFPVSSTPGSEEYVIISTNDPIQTTPRNHFLGGAEDEPGPTDEFILTFNFGVGMDIDVVGGNAGAKARFNLTGLDGDSEERSENSVLVVPNKFGDWPPIERISGRMTGSLEAFADLYVTTLEKSWEWDLIRFDHQFTTDSLIEFIPMTVVQRSTANALVEVTGEAPEILSDLTVHSHIAVPESNASFLIFTEGADGGGTSIRLLNRVDDHSFGSVGSSEIGLAEYVVDLAVVEHWTGEWIVAWSEIAADDANLESPPTTIRAIVGSEDMATWSAPETVAELNGVARRVTAGRAEGTFSYVAWELALEGRDSEVADLGSARYENGSWQTPEAYALNNALRNLETPVGVEATDAAGLFYRNDSALRYLPEGSDTPISILPSRNRPFDMKRDATGASRPYILVASIDNSGISLHASDAISGSIYYGTVLAGTIPEIIAIEPVQNQSRQYFVAWTETDETTEQQDLNYAVVQRSPMAPIDSGTIISQTPGAYTELELVSTGDGEATLYASFMNDDRRGALRQFRLDATDGHIDSDLDEDSLPDAEELRIIDADGTDAIALIQDVLGSDDFDGDGATNAVEIAAGTDPIDPDDYPGVGSDGVGVVALDATASEEGLTPASFQIYRVVDDVSGALTVSFELSGVAVEGVDFASQSHSVEIPAGASFTTVVIAPLADNDLEGPEDVILTLLDGVGYDLLPYQSEAIVTINDLPFNQFRVLAYGAVDGANDAISGYLADSELDGLPTLLEYAFALDPTASDSLNGAPQIILFEDQDDVLYLGIEYRESRSAKGLEYIVETNNGFDAAWRSGDAYTEVVEREPGVDYDLVVVRSLLPVGVNPEEAAFIRVRVLAED